MVEYGKDIVSFPFGNIDQSLMRASSESVTKRKWHHIDFAINMGMSLKQIQRTKWDYNYPQNN